MSHVQENRVSKQQKAAWRLAIVLRQLRFDIFFTFVSYN